MSSIDHTGVGDDASVGLLKREYHVDRGEAIIDYRYIFRLSLARVMITSFVHVLRADRRSAV